MLEIGLGLVDGANGELLCHAAVTKTGDLRKDEPDPMTRLSPGAKLSKDRVVAGRLGGEEAVEVASVAHKPPAAKYILSRTLSCLAMLDC